MDEKRRIASLFVSGKEVTGINFVGDTINIKVDKKGGLMAAVLKLLTTYCSFELTYPKTHEMPEY